MLRRNLRSVVATVTAVVALGTSTASLAADNYRVSKPTFGTMVVDGAVARPLGLGATVLGTAAWIVTLPFSALGGNAGEAARELVIKPARFTFTRPLGEL